jgi:MFS family permease
MGLLASADGMGTLIGALLLAAVRKLPAHGRIFALGALLELVSLLGFAVSPWYALSYVLLFGVGLGNAGFSTMQSTIILLSAAPGMRGRAVGVLGLCIGSTPLGLLELGALSAAVGRQRPSASTPPSDWRCGFRRRLHAVAVKTSESGPESSSPAIERAAEEEGHDTRSASWKASW